MESFPSVVQGCFLRYETYCSFLSQMSLWTKKVDVLYIFSFLSPSDLTMTSTLQTEFKVTYLQISSILSPVTIQLCFLQV